MPTKGDCMRVVCVLAVALVDMVVAGWNSDEAAWVFGVDAEGAVRAWRCEASTPIAFELPGLTMKSTDIDLALWSPAGSVWSLFILHRFTGQVDRVSVDPSTFDTARSLNVEEFVLPNAVGGSGVAFRMAIAERSHTKAVLCVLSPTQGLARFELNDSIESRSEPQ